jgi:uncharacterized protein YjbJ (UPF0337 family)
VRKAKEAVMNAEQFKTSWEQLEGHLKKHWEKLTDEDLLHIEGNLASFDTAIEKRYGKTKDDVNKWTDLWYARWIGSYTEYYAKWKPEVGSRF